MSALYQMLQDTPAATPSLTTQAISNDATQDPSLLTSPVENLTTAAAAAAAAATSLAASFAAEQSTAIIIPPPINNPLTAAPPPKVTSPATPFLSFGSDVPVYAYYVVATATSAPYPIANASTGFGMSPGNATGIVPFTGQGFGRWEMGSTRWQWSMMVFCSAVVVLVTVFL